MHSVSFVSGSCMHDILLLDCSVFNISCKFSVTKFGWFHLMTLLLARNVCFCNNLSGEIFTLYT